MIPEILLILRASILGGVEWNKNGIIRVFRALGNKNRMEYMGQDILLNFGVLVLSMVELKLIIDALQSIDSLSDQSLSVVSRRTRSSIYSYTRRSVSYGMGIC